MASNAASQPFNVPVQPIAGFNPQQQQAFQQYSDLQNSYQPYYNQAQNLFTESSQQTPNVSAFFNPYAGNVISQLQNQQQQQMAALTGNATQTAGGVGADRIGVAQGQLANQQSLATGQTLSSLYGSALTAAQQQQAAQQASAYGLGNLGGAALNSGLGATAALYGSGQYQQQLQQAQQNAQYTNQLQQQAYPFQTAQYLANITGGLAGALGGTTQSNVYGTATPAQPSLLSQIAGGAGAGLAAYNLFNGQTPGSPSSLYTGSQIAGAQGPTSVNGGPLLSGADGGRVSYDSGGGVPDITQGGGAPNWMGSDPAVPSGQIHAAPLNIPKVPVLNMNQSSGSNASQNIMSDVGNIAKVAALFAARGGAIYPHFDSGGSTGDWVNDAGRPHFDDGGDTPWLNRWQDRITNPFFAAGAASGQGTQVPDSIPGGEPATVPLPRPRPADIGPSSVNPDDPVRLDPAATQEWRNGNPLPPPPANNGTDSTAPPAAQPTAGTTPYMSPAAAATADANQRAMQNQSFAAPYDNTDSDSQTSRNLAKNPWLALLAGSLGVMGGTSPFAGVNIGRGLQEGVKTLEQQRKSSQEEETINQRAKQLALEAQTHIDNLTKLTPAQAATIEHQNAQLEQQQWQMTYDPQTGKPYWTKPGETPIPALPGQPSPGGGAAPLVPPTSGPGAPVPPVAGAPQPPPPPLPPSKPKTDFSYTGPSTDPTHGPGPVYNPKTGQPSIEHSMITRKDMEDSRIKSNAAADSMMQINQVEQALDKIDELSKTAGGALQTGAFATQRFALAKNINGMLAPFNIQPVDPELIGSAEEAGKLTTRLGFAVSRTLGSREAQQIVKQAIDANPGIENTPQGRKYIIETMKAAAQRDKDNAQFMADFRKQWRTTAGAEQEFNRLNPPEKYAAQSAIASAPPEFQKPDVLKKAVANLQAHPDDPVVVSTFNKIYHGTAKYFLQQAQ